MPIAPHILDGIMHKALSSDVRREIIMILVKKEMYLSEIANEIKKKPQTVDFHLNILNEIGLIESTWKGGKKYYSLKDKKIAEALLEKKPIPDKLKHKPPHEIVMDAMEDLKRRLDKIEKKIDKLTR